MVDRTSLNYYKIETKVVCERKGWNKAPINTVWLLFTEEVGELASAIRQFKSYFKKGNLKKDRGIDVVMEMGDVFGYLFQLADMLDVDLDEMWKIHKEKMLKKSY
jgi:NTP pyrophosphatase (non-canonical NTP hydrolase)